MIYRKYVKVLSLEIEKADISINDYSVWVCNLPHDTTSKYVIENKKMKYLNFSLKASMNMQVIFNWRKFV